MVSMVIRLDGAPRKKAPEPPVIVVVVAAVKRMVLVEPPVWVRIEKVLAPVKSTVPLPPVVTDNLL